MTKSKLISNKQKEGFVPPDGGWGWMIIFAAGFSNLSTLPMFQQFGLLFRDRFARLGITSSETTTIINMNAALTSCVGLANGPMFRLFSYRQVSFAGAVVVFASLITTTFFCYNFVTYFIFFSVFYGTGYGISSAANALALNTYWKERRRVATGLSWTTTGLGPMVWPHIITGLFHFFGESGTILLLSGFSLHAVACALLLQPVEWHSKASNEENEKKLLETKPKVVETDNDKKEKESGYFSHISKIKNLSAFSSQYLYNEDDPVNTGYEITDPGVPMMTRANDGYFSQSKQSRSRISSRDGSNRNSRLNSKKPSMTNLTENRSRKSSTLYLNESKKNSAVNLGALAIKPSTTNLTENRSRKSSTLYLNESKKNSAVNLGALAQDREKPKRKTSITFETQIPESEIEDCPTLKAPQDLKADEKAAVENIDPEKAKSIADRAEKHLAGNKSSKSLKLLKVDSMYGEKYNKDNHSNLSLKNQQDHDDKKYIKDNHSIQSNRTRNRRKSNNFNYESEVLKQASLKLEQYLKDTEDCENEKFKLLINGNLEDDVFDEDENKDDDKIETNLTFCQKLTLFFDLDLLKDLTFVNLMLGVTLACFNELNFSILTPFILGDFNMSKPEVALFLSILAGVDLSIRFCVPFIAGKIGWDNNTFFLVGVLTMATGRVILAHFHQHYTIVIMVAVIIGFGKGLRTVFMALVIPTYVPLHKLPGASGIQLVTAGIVYLLLGPVVGWIKDNASTAVTLYCLNIFTWLTALSWGLEKYVTAKRQSKADLDMIKV